MLIDYTKRDIRDALLSTIRTAVLAHVENQLWEYDDERLDTPSFKASAIHECMDYLEDRLTVEFKD